MAGPPAPPRYDVPFFVGLEGKDTPWGLARNVSSSGVLVLTEERPPVGEERTIFIVWDMEKVLCRTRVARHVDDGVAVQFLDADPDFLAVIAEIVSGAALTETACPNYAELFNSGALR